MNATKKIAAIDIGTNSFHLIVVRLAGSGNFEIIDREKEVIRLGEGNVGDIKEIKPEPAKRAINTLNRFKGIADSHDAKIRAVATSAVREAFNRNDFLNEVYEKTGIEIEVVSGLEEARLIYLGMLKAVPVFEKKSFCLDIGGGSTEFILGEKGKIIYANSLKLGAVRLSQQFFPDYKLTKDRIDICRRWIEGEIFPVVKKIRKEGFEVCVGSSGTIMNTGLMILADKKPDSSPSDMILNNFEFSVEELKSVTSEVLKRETPKKRKEIPGLETDRADIIPAGLLILSTILKSINAENVTVSGYALREGIIIDSWQKLDDTAEPKLHDIRFESINHLAESSDFDRGHCKHVSILAVQLFDQLKKLHGLGKSSREYLEAAAILHDIGFHISHSKHHRHTYYIIRNSNLLGFNELEIELIANIARYHRKSHPKVSHDDFNKLSKKNKDIVKKLAAILRVADSFDRTHSQNIKNIKIKIDDEKVDLKLDYSNGIPEIELWSFERRKDLFEQVFGKKIRVKI